MPTIATRGTGPIFNRRRDCTHKRSHDKNLVSVGRLLNENPPVEEVQSDAVKSLAAEPDSVLPTESTIVKEVVSLDLKNFLKPGTNNLSPVDDLSGTPLPADGTVSSASPDSLSLDHSEINTATFVPTFTINDAHNRIKPPIDATVEVLMDLNPTVSGEVASSTGHTSYEDTMSLRADITTDPTVDSQLIDGRSEEFETQISVDNTIEEANSDASSEFFENTMSFLKSFLIVKNLVSILPTGLSQPLAQNDGKPVEFLTFEK